MNKDIQSLELVNFRNYRHRYLEDFSEINVFFGENGAGKTNLLEALSLITNLESFRSAQNRDLLRKECGEARIRASRNFLYTEGEIDLFISETKKQIKINGKNKTKRELLDHAGSLTFTPDDLLLIKQGSSKKRDSLDSLACRVSFAFRQLKRDFDEMLRYKNVYLKEQSDSLMLDVINESFIRLAAQYITKRLSLIRYINERIQEVYYEISHEDHPLYLDYCFSWDKDGAAMSSEERLSLSLNELQELLVNNIAQYKYQEQQRLHALIGPQADKIVVSFKNQDAKQFASQGQQRALVLAYKLTQLRFLEEIQGLSPILFLDDVYSELDSKKRQYLSNFIRGKYQTFITCTEFDQSLYLEYPQVYEIG